MTFFLVLTSLWAKNWTSSDVSISVAYGQRWARYSILELFDIDAGYLKIELIDTDTRNFEEVLNRYRYSYRRYKYLDTISGKKSIKKNGLHMN